MTKQLNSVSNLLEHTNLIRKKYDEFAEYTGENFNVFSILGLYSHELSHSTFIGNLLNAKGKHGQKDVFLKLFIEEVKELFQDKSQLENFETSKSFVITEKYTGNGYIDIFITNGRNSIIIENKVWAGDQDQQLFRYHEFDKNAPIIYLTLYGTEPDDSSKGSLKITEDFICISYEKHIVNWLEKCIKEMANKSIIRETLNQYLNLVKQLTNQATNNQMTQEIITKIISKEDNFEAFKSLVNNRNNVLTHFLKEIYVPFLKGIAKKYTMELLIDEENFCNLKQKWGGFSFINEKMKHHNDIKICFSFNNANNYTSLIFGFVPSSNNKIIDNKIQSLFKENFGNYKQTAWICYKEFDSYQDWTNLNTLQKLYFDFENFKQNFEDKLSKMVKIVNDTL